MMRLWSLPIVLSVLLASASYAQTVDKAGLPVVTGQVSVSQSVEVALKNSPTVAARKAMARAAKARVDNARSMKRLTVSVNAFATLSDNPFVLSGLQEAPPVGFTTTPNKGRLDKLINAMYPIYTGGRLEKQISSAGALKEAEDAETAAAGLDAALAVKIAYYQVLYTKMVIEADQERVTEATERVRLAEESFKTGRIAKFDLLRNQTDLSQAQQEVNTATSDQAVAMSELKAALGASQTSDPTLTDKLEASPLTATLEQLQGQALAKRPEIAAAKARVKSAERAVGVARVSYQPQVYATAMAEGWVSKDEAPNAGYVVGIIAGLPLLDGGLRRAEVDEAKAMLEQARAEERNMTVGVTKEVASAYAQLDSAAKNADLAQSAVAQAEEDYRVIRIRYEAGKATNVEVLDALATFTKSQTNKAQALLNQSVALANLERAAGGLL